MDCGAPPSDVQALELTPKVGLTKAYIFLTDTGVSILTTARLEVLRYRQLLESILLRLCPGRASDCPYLVGTEVYELNNAPFRMPLQSSKIAAYEEWKSLCRHGGRDTTTPESQSG